MELCKGAYCASSRLSVLADIHQRSDSSLNWPIAATAATDKCAINIEIDETVLSNRPACLDPLARGDVTSTHRGIGCSGKPGADLAVLHV